MASMLHGFHSYGHRYCAVLVFWTVGLLSQALAQTPCVPPLCHIVDVGLNGGAQFTDRDTGRSSFQINPVPTVIKRGDSVQWNFSYSHSSTSGSCPNGICQASGTWDSQIKPGPADIFRVSEPFTTTGIFPYFCLVHLAAMQGKVMVLDGPEYFLQVNHPGQSFPPPPIPTLTVAKSQVASFSGTISGFLGYTSPVALRCQSGMPRLPNGCPGTTVVPDGIGTPIEFSFPLTDSEPGDYVFDIVAVGSDPAHITRTQQVKLSVIDLSVTNPAPSPVSASPFSFSPQVSFEVSTNITGFVSFFCNGMPPSTFCSFDVFSSFFPPTPQSVTLRMGNFGGTPGLFPVDLGASVFLNGVPLNTSRTLEFIVLGPATHLEGVASASTTKGTPLPIAISAKDVLNHTVTNYSGQVHFSSTDPNAVLPPNHTFGAVDQGVRNFAVTLNTLGPRTVTVNDVFSPEISWHSPMIFVQPSSTPNNQATVSSSRSPTTTLDAYFRNARIEFTVTVVAPGASVAPSGKVHLFDGVRQITPPGGITLSALPPNAAKAVIPIPDLSPGTHMITAVYDGDSRFTASVSQPFLQPRSPAPRCVGDRCPGSH